MERTSKTNYWDPRRIEIIYSPKSLKTVQTKLFDESESDDGEEILKKYGIHKRA